VTPIDRRLIEHIKDRIVERFDPSRIIVFGSHARGTAQATSDLDIFVEMESSRPPLQRAIEVDSIFGLRTWPMDVFVYTPAEVEQLRQQRNSFLSAIESEGKVLYERR